MNYEQKKAAEETAEILGALLGFFASYIFSGAILGAFLYGILVWMMGLHLSFLQVFGGATVLLLLKAFFKSK